MIIRTETIPIKSNKDKQLDSLSEGFYNLSQIEFDEYIKLKDESKKAQKAEEILGKVMLLFLANVQMRIKPEVKEYFKNPKKDKNDKPLSKKITTKETKVYLNNGSKDKDFKLSDRFKVEADDFEGIQKQLPFEIINPYVFYKKSKPINDIDELRKFNGRFSGSLLFVRGSKKGQVHSVDLNVNFNDNGNKISGTYESKISYKGDLYSHNRGRGSNGKIRKSAKGLYLIEMSPNSFLHMRYISEQDHFVGKFYDDDEFVGLAKIFPEGN